MSEESSRLYTPSLPSAVLETRAALVVWISAHACLRVSGPHPPHHQAIKRSNPATVSFFFKCEVHAQTVRAIDPSHVISQDLCVIISLVLCDPLTVWNGSVCLGG